jgi:hypothetical protein
MTQADLERWIERFEKHRLKIMREWANESGYEMEKSEADSDDGGGDEDEDKSNAMDGDETQ